MLKVGIGLDDSFIVQSRDIAVRVLDVYVFDDSSWVSTGKHEAHLSDLSGMDNMVSLNKAVGVDRHLSDVTMPNAFPSTLRLLTLIEVTKRIHTVFPIL